MDEFKCAQCDKWKPMVELGKPRIINGAPQNRCKSCGDNTQDADKETHFKVMIDEEKHETGVCVKCGAREQLMDGRCFDCHDKLESLKNKAIPKQVESPRAFKTLGGRLDFIAEGFERLQGR